jgi:hypothetical protein
MRVTWPSESYVDCTGASPVRYGPSGSTSITRPAASSFAVARRAVTLVMVSTVRVAAV